MESNVGDDHQPPLSCDPPAVSLLEFDAVPTDASFRVEDMRTRIAHLIEGMDKESTLETVIQILETNDQQEEEQKCLHNSGTPTTTSTTTRTNTPGNMGRQDGDIMVSSMSSMNANLSLNYASQQFLNEVPYCRTTTTSNDNMGEASYSLFPHEDRDEVENSMKTDKQSSHIGEETLEGDKVGGKSEASLSELAGVSVLPLLTPQPVPEIKEIVTPLATSTGCAGQNPMLIYRRRAAVSAESVPLNVIETYTPPVIEKTAEEEQVVRAGVMACHLFSNMESRDRAIIVRALQRETYPAGTDILKQGCASLEKLFLITQGTCEVVKNGRVVHTLHVGSTFGEMEMIYHQIMCAATIRCVTNCTLYTLDQRTYQHIVLAVSLHKRKKYEELLCKVGFLKTLSDYDRMLIAEALVTKTYRKDDHILRYGEHTKWMHIIVEGEVKVVGRQNGKKHEFLHLKEGNVIGELEFLFNHLAVADVVAVSRRVTTAQIQRSHLELIVGSIQDHLKEYVLSSGIYSHYLGEANDRIKTELGLLGKRAKRMATKAEQENTLLDQVDIVGEIILPAPKEKVMVMEKNGNVSGEHSAAVTVKGVGTSITPNTTGSGSSSTTHVLFRFPLIPLHANFLAMIGLREDGSIIVWNEMMIQLTGYTAEEAVGQHIYSFLLEPKDQKTMHTAISEARRYTGDVEAFFEEKGAGRNAIYTFARIDGLTKVHLKLSIVPSIVSHGQDAAEIMLAVGEEQRVFPREVMDKSQFLVDQVSSVLRDGDNTYEDRLHRIASLLTSFDSTCRAINASTEDVRVVNIRQMIGQVIMDYGAQCVANGVAVCQRFEGLYAENAYVNAKCLPECLRYAMSNCILYLSDTQVTITVTITETNGLEFLVIVFHDNGPGFPQDILNDFNQRCHSEKYSHLHRVRGAMEKQGGSLSIESIPGDTNVTFTVPFVPAREEMENSNEHRFDVFDISRSFSGVGSPTACSNSNSTSTSGFSHGNNICDIRLPLGKQTFTTLVVEDTAAHRNMLCSFLWDRKHAVLPAYNIEDIEQLIDVADILFIDPHQSIFENSKFNRTEHINALDNTNNTNNNNNNNNNSNNNNNGSSLDPIAVLREKARRMAVVITGSEMDEATCKAYHTAGFLTLKKPCTSIQALQCIRKAEEMISQYKVEAERIEQTRATLSKNSRGAWKRGKLLGKGAFGAVYEATEVLTGGTMAVKEMWLGRRNTQIEQFVNEISTMCNLQHPNIIHYFYCEENKEENVIRVFMEYASGGTLQQLLQKKGKLGFKEYQSLLRDIVEGVAYIHSMHYVHGDLKTANVLLSAEGTGKIGDFGTARTVGEGELLYQMQGSILYMSPECMGASDTDENGNTIGYSFPSDIWSLGCIALEMATNHPPFSHLQNVKGPMGITRYITSLHDTPDLSPLFDGPPGIIEFVSLCLNPDPRRRPTAAELLHLSIFSEATDEDTKSALRVLRRLQLLHELNNFVAFQEPEEVDRRKSTTRRRFLHQRESDFFESSDDNDDNNNSEEEEEGKEEEGKEHVENMMNTHGEDNAIEQPSEEHGLDSNNNTNTTKKKKKNTSTNETNHHNHNNEEETENIKTETVGLADSMDGPSPRERSHTKSRSQTRSYPRVDEDAFFASSSSSSSIISVLHADGNNSPTQTIPSALSTRRGVQVLPSNTPTDAKDSHISLLEIKEEGREEEAANTQESFALNMASFAFMNRSIAFMGASIDYRNMLTNQESALHKSEEEEGEKEEKEKEKEEKKPSHRHRHYHNNISPRRELNSPAGDSTAASETLSRSSPFIKTTHKRHPKRGVKNMFSVEEHKAVPREKSPDIKSPHSRRSRHLDHHSNHNNTNTNSNTNSNSNNSHNSTSTSSGSSRRSVNRSNNTSTTTSPVRRHTNHSSNPNPNTYHYYYDNSSSSSRRPSYNPHLHHFHSNLHSPLSRRRFGVAPQPLTSSSPRQPSSHESPDVNSTHDGIYTTEKQKTIETSAVLASTELDAMNSTVAKLLELLSDSTTMSSADVSTNTRIFDQQQPQIEQHQLKENKTNVDDDMIVARDLVLGLEKRIENLKARLSLA